MITARPRFKYLNKSESSVVAGPWGCLRVIKFRSVGIFSYKLHEYVQKYNVLDWYTVPLRYQKSTGRFMFLKITALNLKYGWRTIKENQKEWAFCIISYTTARIHTHTHFYCYFTQGKKWLQKSVSQKPLRKLLQWQTNTLGAPSSQERDFFLRGNISYSKHQNLSCGQHPKSAFGLTSLFKQKDWYGGIYISMQKYREGQRSRNCPSLPAKLEGNAFSDGLHREPEQSALPSTAFI